MGMLKKHAPAEAGGGVSGVLGPSFDRFRPGLWMERPPCEERT